MPRASNVSRLLLHKKNASPPSNAVMMLGDILGLHFDYKEPDLVNGEHRSPEFKKINPMATIPVLQDGDLTICESHAILKYLVSKYGGEHREKFYPRDFETRAVIDQLMFYDAGVLFVRLKVVALPTILQGLEGPSEQHIADIDEAYSVLEANLSNRLYIATDHLTIADLSLGSTTTAMQSIHKLDSARFPLSAQWLVRLNEEECFKKINAPASNVSRLLLHKRNASPPSSAVMMLGNILGLHFDYKEPDLVSGEHRSPEFKKINPMATIPVLEDGDLTICESHAILKYLVSKYGGEHREKLYPRDLNTRAVIDQLMFYDAGVLFVRLKVVALPTLLQGLQGPSEQHIADIDEAYTVLEANLSNRLYIATDHLTIADLSVGSTTTAMQIVHKLDSARFPLSKQWLARLNQEECFKKINAPGMSEFSTLLNIFWKKNKKIKK